MEQLAPYSSLNYGFTFLVETPNPDQVACTTPSTCPLWDGGGIYIAAKSKSGATVVDASTTAADLTPGLVGVGEACRLARMAPSGAAPLQDLARRLVRLGAPRRGGGGEAGGGPRE